MPVCPGLFKDVRLVHRDVGADWICCVVCKCLADDGGKCSLHSLVVSGWRGRWYEAAGCLSCPVRPLDRC